MCTYILNLTDFFCVILIYGSVYLLYIFFFFFSSRRRHTRYWRDWSSDVCSSDLTPNACAAKGNVVDLELNLPHRAYTRDALGPCHPSPSTRLRMTSVAVRRTA